MADLFDPSTWTLPDLTAVPGDQGYVTVDLTGSTPASTGTTTNYSTGAPQYPGDPNADSGSTGFTAASAQTLSLLPSTSQLSSFLNQAANLLGVGTAAYLTASQYQKVPVNTGNGITGSAYINTATGLPAGSQAVASLLPANLTSNPILLLGAAAAMFYFLSK